MYIKRSQTLDKMTFMYYVMTFMSYSTVRNIGDKKRWRISFFANCHSFNLNCLWLHVTHGKTYSLLFMSVYSPLDRAYSTVVTIGCISIRN